jgi:biopolymer transport protein ExbD
MRVQQTAAAEEFSSTSIFVTPMLDMAFQLMAFFIFTYNPSALEGQFPISLAPGDQGGPAEARHDQVAQPKVSTTTKPAVTVRARAGPKGNLVSLEIVTGGKMDIIQAAQGSEDQPVELLLAELESKLLQYRADDDRLLLQGSIGLRWEESMRVMDSCRQTTQLMNLKKEGKLEQYFPGLKLTGPKRLFPKIEMDLLRGGGAAPPAAGS